MPKTKLDKKSAAMTSVIAHELRGPMGSIRSAASLLASGAYGKLNPEAKKIILLIQNAADRLLNQTESYLEVMQIVDGSYNLEKKAVNISELIKKLVNEWQPQAKLKKIKLVLVCKKLPKKIITDPAVLSHITYNLLDNAIKYTDKGSVTASVNYQDGQLILEVKDTGIGMAEKKISELFKHPLLRKKNPQNSKNGLSLGLYIVSELVKASKGSIKVKSLGKDKGSTFIVHLPAKEFDAKTTSE